MKLCTPSNSEFGRVGKQAEVKKKGEGDKREGESCVVPEGVPPRLGVRWARGVLEGSQSRA